MILLSIFWSPLYDLNFWNFLIMFMCCKVFWTYCRLTSQAAVLLLLIILIIFEKSSDYSDFSVFFFSILLRLFCIILYYAVFMLVRLLLLPNFFLFASFWIYCLLSYTFFWKFLIVLSSYGASIELSWLGLS